MLLFGADFFGQFFVCAEICIIDRREIGPSAGLFSVHGRIQKRCAPKLKYGCKLSTHSIASHKIIKRKPTRKKQGMPVFTQLRK